MRIKTLALIQRGVWIHEIKVIVGQGTAINCPSYNYNYPVDPDGETYEALVRKAIYQAQMTLLPRLAEKTELEETYRVDQLPLRK